MKKLFIAIVCIATIGLFVQIDAYQTLSFSSTGPFDNGKGYTGAPSDNRTCGSNGGCHGGGATNQPGWITSDIPQEGYVPGETYTISAMVELAGRNKFGFQLSPQNSSGQLAGTLTPEVGKTTTQGGGMFISHVSASTNAPDSKTWSFDWTAPGAGFGDVTFYAAFNAANNNGATSGDMIFSSTLDVSENTSTGIGNRVANSEDVKVYPNPSNGNFTLHFENNVNHVTISLIDLRGSLIKQLDANTSFSEDQDVQFNLEGELTPGVYIVQIEGKKVYQQQRLIVR